MRGTSLLSKTLRARARDPIWKSVATDVFGRCVSMSDLFFSGGGCPVAPLLGSCPAGHSQPTPTAFDFLYAFIGAELE